MELIQYQALSPSQIEVHIYPARPPYFGQLVVCLQLQVVLQYCVLEPFVNGLVSTSRASIKKISINSVSHNCLTTVNSKLLSYLHVSSQTIPFWGASKQSQLLAVLQHQGLRNLCIYGRSSFMQKIIIIYPHLSIQDIYILGSYKSQLRLVIQYQIHRTTRIDSQLQVLAILVLFQVMQCSQLLTVLQH